MNRFSIAPGLMVLIAIAPRVHADATSQPATSSSAMEASATRGFTIAVRKADQDAVNAALGGDVAANLKGKIVLVTGEITLYKEKPEIEVTKPDQIQLESK